MNRLEVKLAVFGAVVLTLDRFWLDVTSEAWSIGLLILVAQHFDGLIRSLSRAPQHQGEAE